MYVRWGSALILLTQVWFPNTLAGPTRWRRSSSGTPVNLEEIFVGRCHEYQEVLFPQLFHEGEKDCKELYRLFVESFRGKPECGVTHEDYAAFFEAARHPIPDNLVLWEGVGGFIHEYTTKGRRMFAVSNMMAPTIISGLTWCGTESGSGIKYEDCAWCDQSAVITFWRRASIQFADLVRGDVYLVLNGSRTQGAVREQSIFSVYELPNLDPSVVSSIHALIVHDVDKPEIERCEEGSLQKLRQQVQAKGIIYECTDDRPDFAALVCVDHWQNPKCQCHK